MNEVKNIIEQLRKAKLTLLLLIFLSFILFYYKSLITNVVETKIKKDEIKHDIKNSILIHQMLNDLMLRYKADRGYIFRFHNGIMYYDGTHKNHQSLAYEVCNRGISSEAMQLQNLPTSLFPRFLQEIMLNKMCYSNINDIKENATRIALHEQGIRSVVACPVFKDGKFTAYIGLDFVKDTLTKDFNYHEFRNQTDEIGRILTQ
jgi:hypothetical protein